LSSHTLPPLGFIFHSMERSTSPWIISREHREGRSAGGPWTGPASATLVALVLAFLWNGGLAAQETETDTIADAVPDTAASDSAAADTPTLEPVPSNAAAADSTVEVSDAVAADTAAAGPTDTVAADSTVGPAPAAAPSLPGPAGAFLRGATIPGWGHAASGSLTRGAFYFGFEAAAGWMLLKTMRRLGSARQQLLLWEERVAERLERSGVTEPDEIEAELGRDEEVLRLRSLVDARESQREDWFAVALFTLLMSGVDAFVSAHLQNFPDPLTVEGGDGSVEVAVRLPTR
ncbi:MAG: hypothetical protein OXG18_10045, partial [Gemmatimonadetes bacterium]|nr:hypothetical protein [Gemmatimonadota bacterium]